MFISVVVPAYNEERYLPACLQALRSQSLSAGKYEIIVVDNASTDATALVATRYGARVTREPRKGVARARQTGFENARGEVIASTDADSQVPADWLARIAAHFESDPTLGALYGPVHWPEGHLIERWALRYPITWILWLSNKVGCSLWWGSNFAVRADVFHAAGGFSVDWPSGEDTDLSLRVDRLAPVRFDPELIVHASNRRSREGWPRVAARSTMGVLYRFVLRQPPPLPMTDIR